MIENSAESEVYPFASTPYKLGRRFAEQTDARHYGARVADLVGTVNDAPFCGADAGECLFTGVSEPVRSGDAWVVGLRFQYRSNTVVTVGKLAPVDTGGWEFLSVDFATGSDGVRRPESVAVLKPYETGDFSRLQVGRWMVMA